MSFNTLLICDTVAQLQSAAALLIAGAIREVLQKQELCRIALSGGTTPGPVYRHLVNAHLCGPLPLHRIHLLFGDERCVPPDHPDSNYRMAAQWFGDAFSQFGAVRRIRGEEEPVAEALRCASDFAQPIDMLILGMGEDGHVASIFPHSAAFDAGERRTMAVDCPKPPPRRITITPAVIEAASQIFVVVSGGAKADAVARVFEKDVSEHCFPARLAQGGTWLLDRSAAANFISNKGDHS